MPLGSAADDIHRPYTAPERIICFIGISSALLVLFALIVSISITSVMSRGTSSGMFITS